MIKQFDQFEIMANTESEIDETRVILEPVINKLNQFFNIKPYIRIQIIYSPEEFKFYKGNFENWMVGTASKQNLWIFKVDLIESFTVHDKKCFEKVLTHEASHIYVNSISPFIPIWLNEGIAVYLSEPLDKRKDFIRNYQGEIYFFKQESDTKKMQFHNYILAPCFVEHMINKVDKENFLKFLGGFLVKLEINSISNKYFGDTIEKEFIAWKNDCKK